jgi:hypothetical protein
MSTLELATLLPPMGELTASMAERWIAAALAQAAALRQYDRWLYPHDPALLPTAERLHEAWRKWADDAESLLKRVHDLTADGKKLQGLDAFHDALGFALTMLQMTPAEANRRREGALHGKTYTIEEVRRELGLRDRR